MGSKAESKLKWILWHYPNGYFRISVRGVPCLVVKKGDMDLGIAYFGKSDSFRIFANDIGEKWDIKTQEEVVAYLKGGENEPQTN